MGTIAGMWLVGSKRWEGWVVGLANQVMWISFAVAYRAWGLLPLTAWLIVVYTRNLVRWRREETGAGVIGRRVETVADIERPGDYCGPTKGYTGDKLACFFLKPNARDDDAPARARSLQHVTFPPHTYRECADGSLEIRNSIGDTVRGGTESDGWHGFLDEGHVWRKV